MPGLFLVVLLGLACYRVVRFVAKDTLWEATRERLFEWLTAHDPPKVWRDKLYELLSCPFCLGIWVGGGMVIAADFYTSVPLPVFAWLAVAAVSSMTWTIIEK